MKGKTLISTITGFLLCFWYLVAIVGIDVHIDHHGGGVFVVSLLCPTDCESIHPEDVCHCVEHHHGRCAADDEDCENEICIISITGDGSDFVCNLAPESFPAHLSRIEPQIQARCDVSRIPAALTGPPREHLMDMCVLRV